MRDSALLPNGLAAEVTRSLVSLWTQYAGKPPSKARTEIRGNVVTCVLVDAVGNYNRSAIAPQTGDTVRGVGKLTPAAYKREADRGRGEADPPARRLVGEQPRPRHGRRHRGVHPGAIVQARSAPNRRPASAIGLCDFPTRPSSRWTAEVRLREPTLGEPNWRGPSTARSHSVRIRWPPKGAIPGSFASKAQGRRRGARVNRAEVGGRGRGLR